MKLLNYLLSLLAFEEINRRLFAAALFAFLIPFAFTSMPTVQAASEALEVIGQPARTYLLHSPIALSAFLSALSVFAILVKEEWRKR